MAHPSECYAALCNIRSTIVEQLMLLGYPVEEEDCSHKCLTELMNIYSSYTGRTYVVDNLEAFMNNTVPSAEWLNKVIECTGDFAICLEVNIGEYAWTTLEEASVLIEHTIKADGTYDASDFAADGFSKVVVDTSANRNLQNKTVEPSSEILVVSADRGFNGLGTVTVKAVPTEKAYVIPTEEKQIIEPTDGFFFKQVVVDSVINQTVDITPSATEQVVRPEEGFNGLAEVRVAGDASLLPENILKDIIIFGIKGTLELNGAGSKPIELHTAEDMELRRATASQETLGTIYKYTGPSSGEYVTNMLYVIGYVDNAYVMQKLSTSLLRLAAPSIKITNNTVSWEPVPYATTYAVCTDSYTLGYTADTSFVVSHSYASSLVVHVIAIATGYENSFDSNAVTWFASNVAIVKHSNIPFAVPTYYSKATDFNNKAVFYCLESTSGNNNKFLMFDASLVSSEYDIDDTGTMYDCLSSSKEHLFLTDAFNILAYDVNMSKTNIPLLYKKDFKVSAKINNYVIFAGGILEGYNVYDKYAEAIDDNLVNISLGETEGHSEYDLIPCSAIDYAMFIDGKYIGYAYDKDLVRHSINNLPMNCYSMSAASSNNYAIYAGGETHGYDEENFIMPEYTSQVFAYDENMLVRQLTDISAPKRNIITASFNGFAVFAGGFAQVGEESTSSRDVEVFDASLTHKFVATPLCSDKASAGIGTEATTISDKYLIVGATDDFMFADVFTTERI